MHMCMKKIVIILATFSSSFVYAEDLAELSSATVTTVNTFLWIAVVLGIITAWITHKIMYKKLMAFDVLLPIIPAILMTFFIIYIPYFLSADQDFGKLCFQTITDNNGQVRDSISLAYECALSRESLSAWGISGIISAYKAAFGYTASDSYLSTNIIRFFYYTIAAFWVIALYLLSLFIFKKLKN